MAAISTSATNEVRCPRCKSGPGRSCRSPSGRTCDKPHGDRVKAYTESIPWEEFLKRHSVKVSNPFTT